jgi:hypothetical protein
MENIALSFQLRKRSNEGNVKTDERGISSNSEGPKIAWFKACAPLPAGNVLLRSIYVYIVRCTNCKWMSVSGCSFHVIEIHNNLVTLVDQNGL